MKTTNLQMLIIVIFWFLSGFLYRDVYDKYLTNNEYRYCAIGGTIKVCFKDKSLAEKYFLGNIHISWDTSK